MTLNFEKDRSRLEVLKPVHTLVFPGELQLHCCLGPSPGDCGLTGMGEAWAAGGFKMVGDLMFRQIWELLGQTEVSFSPVAAVRQI